MKRTHLNGPYDPFLIFEFFLFTFDIRFFLSVNWQGTPALC
jgi:hypothetical protein